MKKTPNGQFLSGAFALSLTVLFTACRSTPTPTAPELKSLQGYWQGEGPAGNISINITGNSLNYYARPDQWFKTTFTLPAGTAPKKEYRTTQNQSDQGRNEPARADNRQCVGSRTGPTAPRRDGQDCLGTRWVCSAHRVPKQQRWYSEGLLARYQRGAPVFPRAQ